MVAIYLVPIRYFHTRPPRVRPRAIIIIDNLFNTRQAAQWTVECNCIYVVRAAGELQAIGSRQNRTAVDAYKKLGHYVTRRFPEVPEHKRQTPAGPTRAKSNRYHMPHRARASQLTHAQTSSLCSPARMLSTRAGDISNTDANVCACQSCDPQGTHITWNRRANPEGKSNRTASRPRKR